MNKFVNSINPEYENLINSLIKGGYLKTPEIIAAFRAIDRADFVLEKYKSEAYVDAPLPIGFSQTISQPLTVAFMLELLEPKKGEKILDIGSGSGWVSALLAQIVGEKGKIIGIERIKELKKMAEKNVSKYNYIKKGVVKIILGDGSKGYEKEAPYDKIIAGAASQGELPKEWKKQLKINGRIVAPLENSVVVMDKIKEKKYIERKYFGFSFVPLIAN